MHHEGQYMKEEVAMGKAFWSKETQKLWGGKEHGIFEEFKETLWVGKQRERGRRMHDKRQARWDKYGFRYKSMNKEKTESLRVWGV